MQLELYPCKQPGVLKVVSTNLDAFGERVDVFFVREALESMSAVSFLEPSEGVTLVNGSGHITEF